MKASAISSTSNWEDVRKRARQLENEIDAKLLSLSKLNLQSHESSLSSSRNFRLNIEADKSPLLTSNSKLDELTHEVEGLLTKLTEVNDLMTNQFGSNRIIDSSKSGVNASHSNPNLNPTLLHTVQRHRDILQDYCSEFHRVQANIRARVEREQLLFAGNNSNASDRLSSFNDHRNDDDPYLKEHEHSRSSDRLLDQQISIAITTKEHLQNQRSGLQDISTKLHHLSKRYPAISSVMQKINWRKRRDTIIVGTVISVCLFLMFIYATR